MPRRPPSINALTALVGLLLLLDCGESHPCTYLLGLIAGNDPFENGST